MATEYRQSIDGIGGEAGDVDNVIDPALIGAGSAEPEPERAPNGRKRRSDIGKPRKGSGASAKTAQKVALDLSALNGLLVGIHALLADRTKTPELAIEMDEGKMFLDSAKNVMRHYSVETTQKTLDMVAMIGTVGTIYGPRIVAINIRKAGEKAAKEAGAGTVGIDITGLAGHGNVHVADFGNGGNGG